MQDSLPEHVRDVLADVVTLEMCEAPLVVASDGYTYNLHSLREHLKHDALKRSPRTGEMLRRTAFRALDTERLLWAHAARCAADGTVLALYDDGDDPLRAPLPMSMYTSMTFKIKMEQLLTSSTCVRVLQWANLIDDRAEIVVHVVALSKRKKKAVIQSYPPVADLVKYGRELADCSCLDTMFANSHHLLTCLLNDGTTIEGRVLRHRYEARLQ